MDTVIPTLSLSLPLPSPEASEPVLNLHTPLAFVSEDEAKHMSIFRDVLAITVGAWLWDVIVSLPQEIKMYRRRQRLALVDFIYLAARLATSGHVIATFLFYSLPFHNCHIPFQIALGLGVISRELHSMLFLFRVFAVFHNDPKIKYTFALLWSFLLLSFLSMLPRNGKHIGPTKKCTMEGMSPIIPAAFCANAFYDSVVFCGISWRVCMEGARHKAAGGSAGADAGNGDGKVGWREWARIFFGVDRVGRVYRMLLRSGQMYYLVAICSDITAITAAYSNIPTVFKASIMIINGLLCHTMGCRVFRLLRLNVTDNTRDSFVSISSYPPLPNVNPTDDIVRSPRHHRRQHSPIVFINSIASTESQQEYVLDIGSNASGDSTLISAANPSFSSNGRGPRSDEKDSSTLGSRGNRSGGSGSDISLGFPTESEGHTVVEMSNLDTFQSGSRGTAPANTS